MAAGLSLCQGYRGYVNQRVWAQSQEVEAGPDKWFWSRGEVRVVRCLYDAFFYTFCSVVGFAAFWLAAYMFNSVQDLHDISGGTSAFLVFLVVLGLLGVSGQLPYLIQLGKFPK
jgi:hypothetical protein